MLKIYIFVTLFFLYYNANSQTIDRKLISASQQTIVTNEFSYSWSVGEPVIASDNIQVSSGYHSKATLFIIPITSTGESQTPLIRYYPNPSNRFLNVDMSQLEKRDYVILLYDLKGSDVTPSIATDDFVNKMDMSSLKAGMYHLHVLDSKTNKLLMQFKIIKR